MRDSASTKRLVVWSERIVHMNDRVMTPETHIRQDQGNEVLSFFRNRLVEDRPKAAKGAEGRAQPPSMDEVTVSVRAAKAMNDGPAGGISRMGSAAVAALSYIPDTDNLGDDDDEEEDVHFVEVSTVSGISLAGIQAGQASRRPPGRNPIKRGRTASTGIGSTARRGRDVERLEGCSVTTEPVATPAAAKCPRHSGRENHAAGKNGAAPATTKPPANHHQTRGTATTGGNNAISNPAPPSISP